MSQTVKIATVTLNPTIDQTVFIPNFRAGEVNRVAQTQFDPGGKGVNVAWFLADYGFPISVTGFLGEENIKIFERLFTRKQIEDRFVKIDGRTRSNIKIVDEVKQETTDINFPGQTPTATDIQTLFQIVEAMTTDCDWFVLAGSIPTGCQPGIYRDLVGLIKQRGRAVALDTSGEALRLALPAGPNLVKPNIDELQELEERPLKTEAEVIEAARNWLSYDMETVIVSMGGDGALFVAEKEVVLAQPPTVTVKSTVGAGDAMVSGTVAGKSRGASLAECARLGTAFSLSAISRVGAGLPSLAVIEAFMSQVVVVQKDN
jgi:1-phosphofructokinase